MSKISHIGDRIKKARIKLNISQIQLSEALGINQSNISRIEQGTQEPSISQLRVLKLVLKVDYEYLIDGKTVSKNVSKIE